MHRLLAVSLVLVAPAYQAFAEDLTAGLNSEKLNQVRAAADRGLEFVSKQQNADGSFSDKTQPSVRNTSLVVLAFLSRGHQPGQGRYGKQMERAIDWLLSTQREDGSFSTEPPSRLPFWTHATTGIALCEAFGFMAGAQSERVSDAVRRALAYSRQAQQTPKVLASFNKGWGYHTDAEGNQRPEWSDVRSTCWELCFMRSAHNAGFKVPQDWVDEGLGYIERCYRPGPIITGNYDGRRLPVPPNQGVFFWSPEKPPGRPQWADTDTTSAGILAFLLHGRRDDPMSSKTADWVARQLIADQAKVPSFYYTCYITSQAMAQVGGKHWKSFYPHLVEKLLPYQDPDGHFRLERSLWWSNEPARGTTNYTAVAVLCLTLPDQLLPIHQR